MLKCHDASHLGYNGSCYDHALRGDLSPSRYTSLPQNCTSKSFQRRIEFRTMIGKALSHYKILEKLGQGGMGVVYKAEDTRLRRPVAIKMLPPEFAKDQNRIRRLMMEAQAASSLNHQNICTIYELEEVKGVFFIAMEYIQGHSLREEILQGPIPWERSLRISLQIAEALETAHRHNIVHRDIKPSNILITDQEVVKILDFGLAQIFWEVDEEKLSEAITQEKITELGHVVGTTHYMSPEQIHGHKVDARSDLFSFGVLLYEMLAARLPFRGSSVYEVMNSILKEPADSLTKSNPNIPLSFQRVIEKAMAKNREMRYQTSTEIIHDLKKVGDNQKDYDTQARRESVAVRYFENLSGAKEEEYFRDGMTEDVITELSKIRDLKVFPRSAVVSFRDKPFTVSQIGQELDASYVLEGSLRRSGNRIRITAQLVEVYNGHSVWAERYDRELKDVFDLQDEIARSIANALRITLSPQEEVEIAQKPTENTEAYDYYLRGRGYARRRTESDLEYAVEMFNHALSLQPDFALAHAGMANVYVLFDNWYREGLHWIDKARLAAERALALDPELPEALAAQAGILIAETNYEEAIRCTRKAIARKPDCENAYWQLGRALFLTKRLQESADTVNQAIESSGDDYNIYIPFTLALETLGKSKLGVEVREKHTKALKRQLAMYPEDVRARMLLACNLAYFGKEEEAVQELQKVIQERPLDPMLLYNAACAYGILQRKKDALETFKKAAFRGNIIGIWAEKDPDLACLHDDPEFIRLMAELRQQKPQK
ncbi:MAG: protein kinase [Acidobacteria bacterium]|nr:MAG: protein kinase [Acidobacteriota bacterium]